jgi:hypothetical protein
LLTGTQPECILTATTTETFLHPKEDTLAKDLIMSDVSQQSLPLTPMESDSKQTALLPPTPRTVKHEAAITELKSFISSVLSSKLDEIKSSVAIKIQGSDEAKKDVSKPKSSKK